MSEDNFRWETEIIDDIKAYPLWPSIAVTGDAILGFQPHLIYYEYGADSSHSEYKWETQISYITKSGDNWKKSSIVRELNENYSSTVPFRDFYNPNLVSSPNGELHIVVAHVTPGSGPDGKQPSELIHIKGKSDCFATDEISIFQSGLILIMTELMTITIFVMDMMIILTKTEMEFQMVVTLQVAANQMMIIQVILCVVFRLQQLLHLGHVQFQMMTWIGMVNRIVVMTTKMEMAD